MDEAHFIAPIAGLFLNPFVLRKCCVSKSRDGSGTNQVDSKTDFRSMHRQKHDVRDN